MIERKNLVPAGKFNKPHGITGEISVTLDYILENGSCIVTDMDGIYVPFFVDTIRPKNNETYLITLDGIESDSEVREFVNKEIFIPINELSTYSSPEESDFQDDDSNDEGIYAAMLAGFTVVASDGTEIGTIDGIEDSTTNVLFIVLRPDGSSVLIPVADDLITDIDMADKVIEMDLPEGILNLN